MVSLFFTGYSFFQVVLEAECIIWFVKLSLEIFLRFAIIKILVSIVEILGMMETSASFQKQVFLEKQSQAKCMIEKWHTLQVYCQRFI